VPNIKLLRNEFVLYPRKKRYPFLEFIMEF